MSEMRLSGSSAVTTEDGRRLTLVEFLEIVCDTDGAWFRRMPLYIQSQLNAECDIAYLEDDHHPRHLTFRIRIPIVR
jgi:hypothetical protein